MTKHNDIEGPEEYMKKQLVIFCLISSILILSLPSCSLLPIGSSNVVSSDDLLGEWDFISSENGSADLAYDIEFLSDGTLRIIEEADALVDEYQYEVTKPGKMTVSALGVEQDVKYEISGDQLRLNFDKGYNLYAWTGIPRETEDISLSIERTPTAIDLDIPKEIETPEGIKIGREVITHENAERVVELKRIGKGFIYDIAWSPDGEHLAIGSTIGIYLFNSYTLTQELYIETMDLVSAVAFSPDGKTLASGSSRTIHIWDAVSGQNLRMLESSSSIITLDFSPDGRLLASGGFGDNANVWDVASGQKVLLLEHTSYVHHLDFSPDSRTVASLDGDGIARIWETSSGKQLTVIEDNNCSAVAFSPDGKTLALGDLDGTVVLWDTANWQLRYVLEGQTDSIRDIEFTPDGTTLLALGQSDGTSLSLWNTASGHQLHLEYIDGEFLGSFAMDGRRMASFGIDGVLRLWEAGNCEQLCVLDGFQSPVYSISFAPDGSTLATGGIEYGSVRLWDMVSGKYSQVLERGTFPEQISVTFSPDGMTLVSGGLDGTLRIWDTASGQQLKLLEGDGKSIQSVTFSPDGSTLASGDWAGTIRFWDAENGEIIRELPSHTGKISAITYSPDGNLIATAGEDGIVRVWNEWGDQLLREFLHDSSINDINFSPDGKLLASGDEDGNVYLWDLESSKELIVLEGHTSPVKNIAFSQDGSILASGSSDCTVRLWDVMGGKSLHVLKGHTREVYSVAFSPNGRVLASGSDDGTVRLWGIP